jgi:hypothetical protein
MVAAFLIIVIDNISKAKRIRTQRDELIKTKELSEKYSVEHTLIVRKYDSLIKSSDADRIKLKTYTNVLTAYNNDLESYSKVAKGYEVAGIKKSLKLLKDHTTTLGGESLI